jgi:hypothetical protein
MDSIKINMKEIVCDNIDWIYLAQRRIHLQLFVYAEIDPRFP